VASEIKRGCGYRKVGGMYLVGNYINRACDRLPYPLDVCPTCGQGIKVGRGMTGIIPSILFGTHADCIDKYHPCFMCDPTDAPAFIMLVGERHYPTPNDFMNEGVRQGFSKRIAQIPRNFQIIERTGFKPDVSLQDGIAEKIKGHQIIRKNQFTNI